MRALVVEDEFISRTVLEKLLASVFTVDTAVNGEEAIQAFEIAHKEQKPYALILMDIMMPGINGLEALEQIRSKEDANNFPKAKVIMTTALSDVKTVMRSFDSGQASAYLVKPLDRDKLFRELRNLELIHD